LGKTGRIWGKNRLGGEGGHTSTKSEDSRRFGDEKPFTNDGPEVGPT